MRQWLAFIFASLALGIAATALAGYIIPRTHGLRDWSAMALPTAIAIALGALSQMLLLWSLLKPDTILPRTELPRARDAGRIDPRALAAVMVVCLLICGGAWYHATKAVSAANRERHLATVERAQAAHEYAEAVTIRNQAKLAALNQRRHFENSWARWGHVRTFVTAFVPGGES